jgi:lipopolysaccharide/colanic/teichoic acid biosynthesis glycosyltransferase
MIIKRILDISFSVIGLILFLPFGLIVSILIYYKLGSPIFFTQPRVGKKGKVFNMIKFRTMLDLHDKNGEYLSDEERLTNFGAILRSLSIDELPELINVIKGDMSLVGPRPLLVEYLSLYNDDQIKRHDVLPGITGLAQVNGRNSISWDKKFQYDIEYVKNWSLILDIKILAITVIKVFKRSGISQKGNVTVEKFDGFN